MRDFQWLALAPLLCALGCGSSGEEAPGLVATSGGAGGDLAGGSGGGLSGGAAGDAGQGGSAGTAQGGSMHGGSSQGGNAGGADQGGAGSGGGAGEPAAPPFPAVTDFSAKGPFATASGGEGPSCTVFRPETLGEEGRKHPIVLWGNGTTAAPPIYAGVLTHWASHGFVVAAANTSNAGTGKEMIACLDYLADEAERSGSDYEGKLDLARVGTSGHSQGGGGSIMAGADPRVRVTAPLEPYVTGLGHDSDSQKQQHGPMFLMSGGNDLIAPRPIQQQPIFDNTNADVFWGTLKSADHLIAAVGDISDFRGPATAWLRLHLMDDESARTIFYGAGCSLCLSPGWTVEKKGIQ